jgi:ABC-type sugar transport system ATPase subunit
MASIRLDGVSAKRGKIQTITDVSLSISDGEFLVIIGPSGSGKTSLLRVIGGLDKPSSGDVLFDGDVVTQLPAARRDVAMVFQDNALIPFRTVRKNVAFPLEVHHVDAEEIEDRVLAESRVMAIERFLSRMPGELAAGHQQLTQVARALVRRPQVLLLDEPLARVDPLQRETMRNEIKLLQSGYGVTTVYATNDPGDAMSLADRIAIIDRGHIRQVGTPFDLYHHPVDTFVAGFLGSPAMNFLEGQLGEREVRVSAGALPIPHQRLSGPVTVGVRPHDWEVVATAGLTGEVTAIEDHGDYVYATVNLNGDEIVMRVEDGRPDVGGTIEIWTRRFNLFDRSGRAIAQITSL